MDTEQLQRKDIDNLTDNTVSLAIDDDVGVNEEIIDLLSCDRTVNNWYLDNNNYLVKNYVTDYERLVFAISENNNLKFKDISEIRLQGIIYTSSPLNFKSIGIATKFTNIEKTINGLTDVDELIDISEFRIEDLNSLINNKGFDIVINVSANNSNTSVRIEELTLTLKFTDKLSYEREALINRLNPYIQENLQGKLIAGSNITITKNNVISASGGSGTSVQADWAENDNTHPAYIKNKPSIPSKTSQLNNDVGFITNSYHDNTKQDIISDLNTIRSKSNSALQPNDNISKLVNDVGYLTEQSLNNYYTKSETDSAISNHHDTSKVDVVEGKQLSTNDYTNSEKTKLASLENYDDARIRADIVRLITDNFGIRTHLSEIDVSKQDILISGSNIKTINNQSLLGSGNIAIGGGGQVQADYAQTDSTQVDYIKNKPSMKWETAYTGDGFTIYQNNTFYYIVIQKSVTWETANTNVLIGTIPSQYRPNSPMRMKGHDLADINIYIKSDGQILARCSSIRTATANASFMYPVIN